MAVHEEFGGHDVQLLADVFANAHHRPVAAGLPAVGVHGFVAMLHAPQVLGRCLALWCPALLVCGLARLALALERLQLRKQTRLVLCEGLLEQPPLLGLIASLLAPNFQAFSRASLNVTFCSLASRQEMSRSLRWISWASYSGS